MDQTHTNQNETHLTNKHLGCKDGSARSRSLSVWPNEKQEFLPVTETMPCQSLKADDFASECRQRKGDIHIIQRSPSQTIESELSYPLLQSNGVNPTMLPPKPHGAESTSDDQPPPESQGLAAQLMFQKGRLKKRAFLRSSSSPATAEALHSNRTVEADSRDVQSAIREQQKEKRLEQCLQSSAVTPIEHRQLTVQELANLLQDKIPMLIPGPPYTSVAEESVAKQSLSQQLQKQRIRLTKPKLFRSHSAPMSPSSGTAPPKHTVRELVALLQDKLYFPESKRMKASHRPTLGAECLQETAALPIQKANQLRLESSNSKTFCRSQSTPITTFETDRRTEVSQPHENQRSSVTTSKSEDDSRSEHSSGERVTPRQEEILIGFGQATQPDTVPYDEIVSGNHWQVKIDHRGRKKCLGPAHTGTPTNVGVGMVHHPFDEYSSCAAKFLPGDIVQPHKPRNGLESTIIRSSESQSSTATEQTVRGPQNSKVVASSSVGKDAISGKASGDHTPTIPSEIVLNQCCLYGRSEGEEQHTSMEIPRFSGNLQVEASDQQVETGPRPFPQAVLSTSDIRLAVNEAQMSLSSKNRQARAPLCSFLHYRSPVIVEKSVCRFLRYNPPTNHEHDTSKTFPDGTSQRILEQSHARSIGLISREVNRLSRLVDELDKEKTRPTSCYDPLDAAVSKVLKEESSSLLRCGVTVGASKNRSLGMWQRSGEQVKRPPIVSLFHGS